MNDLISRQDAIDLVESFYKIDKSVLNTMVFKLKQLPSVEPKSKQETRRQATIPSNRTGKWIVYESQDGLIRRCTCNECGFSTHEKMWTNPNFCPNCGCRMEEGDSDDNH